MPMEQFFSIYQGEREQVTFQRHANDDVDIVLDNHA
jgi:hypothetical protein